MIQAWEAHVSPRLEDRHHDRADSEAGSDLTLGGDTPFSAPAVTEDKPFNLSMYLDFLPGTD